MTQAFKIKAKLPSLNEYIGACRANKYAGAKLKADTEQVIGWFIRAAKITPISEPVFITFEWHKFGERRDLDNIAAAKKFILDALQSTQILPNDNKSYVRGFTDKFYYDTADHECVVILKSIL
jgi:Holliday junction resolvase RusA-like endonuclease